MGGRGSSGLSSSVSNKGSDIRKVQGVSVGERLFASLLDVSKLSKKHNMD